jgi:glutathione synthase/RimK-type ligase-like ATP-grasp enzyme
LSRAAVLIVTNEQDVGADFLVREFDRRRVRVIRFNSERAPEWRLTVEPNAGWRLVGADRTLDSEECVGVWWRRPEVPEVAQTEDAAEAVADQWRAFLLALEVTPGPVWASKPSRIRVAENKALQLRIANDIGFDVPRTVWTNDLDEANSLLDHCDGAAAVKSVATAWWEESGEGTFVYTSLIESDDLPVAARLAQAPLAFQEPITPKRDVRVTVVEEVVLAAIQTEAPENTNQSIDWRLAPQHRWVRHDLPTKIARHCRDLVRAFDLRFGAIDLAIDRQGVHWFLELNPNGEWGWLQRIGLPIAEALADVLTDEKAME